MITDPLHYAAILATRLRHHRTCTQEWLTAFLKTVNSNAHHDCDGGNPGKCESIPCEGGSNGHLVLAWEELAEDSGDNGIEIKRQTQQASS